MRVGPGRIHVTGLYRWRNFALTGILLAVTFYLAWRRSFSPLEIVSLKAD